MRILIRLLVCIGLGIVLREEKNTSTETEKTTVTSVDSTLLYAPTDSLRPLYTGRD